MGKLFNKNYRIDINDIKQLLTKVTQEFDSCTVLSATANVSVRLGKNIRYEFRNWKEFEEFDKSHSERTSSVQTEIVIDVIRKEGLTPERYSVQVSAQNNLNNNSLIMGNLAFVRPGTFPVPPSALAVEITFNNYIIGKNLQSTIDNWEQSLQIENSKIIDILQKKTHIISDVIPYLAAILSLLLAYKISKFDLKIETWICLSAASTMFSLYIGNNISTFITEKLEKINRGNIITLTRGDENHSKKITKSNTTLILKAIASLLFFVLQVLAALYIEKIFDKF